MLAISRLGGGCGCDWCGGRRSEKFGCSGDAGEYFDAIPENYS